MRAKFALALLLIGLVVISAGCIGGGSKEGTPTSSSTSSQAQTTSTSSAPTTTTTTTTSQQTTTTTSTPSVPRVSIGEIGNYVGKNVSVEGLLLGLSYDSANHVYVISIGENGAKVNVTAKRELLSVLNPLEVGVGSKILVTGEVKSREQLSAGEIEVVEKKAPTISKIKDLSAGMLGKIVVIEGNIVSTKKIGSNLKLTVTDGTGEIAVFIPGSVVKELSNETLSGLKEGLGVKIGGYIDEYKGTLEVIPYVPEGIVAYGKPLEIETTTTTTTTSQQTTTTTQTEVQWVTVSGLSSASGTVQLNATWVRLYYSKPNYLIEVSDDTGKANLTAERELLPNPVKAGTGSVLHLVVDASSMKVLNLTVVSPQPSPLLSTANVTAELLGKTVVVQGTVSDFKTLGANLKFLVVDGSGNITVFVPSSVASKLPEDVKSKLQNGVTVEIGGYVTEYKGTIEIIPYSVEGIEILT